MEIFPPFDYTHHAHEGIRNHALHIHAIQYSSAKTCTKHEMHTHLVGLWNCFDRTTRA